jgi:DNA-binding NtrC family response regulator
MTSLVWVIDDDTDYLRLMSDMLSEAGYRVELFSDPHVIINGPDRERPVVIILDLLFAHVAAGWTLLEILRRRLGRPAIPVILTSVDVRQLNAPPPGFHPGGKVVVIDKFKLFKRLPALLDEIADRHKV